MKTIEIHTDGSCLGNPGPGGWAALLRYKGHERELSGGEAHTTNNRMELMAAISGLETLTEPCNIVLYTDSQYVRQGPDAVAARLDPQELEDHGGDPVKNRELWERLHAATLRHQIDWRWVRATPVTRTTSGWIRWRATRPSRSATPAR